MMGLNWFDNVHFSFGLLFGGGLVYGNHTALRNFVLAWLALAVYEHFKRLDEEKRGVQPHNYSPGVSRLGLGELLPFSPKVIAVAVEPGLVFLAGAVLRRLGFSMLGWVIGSAVCFAISQWRLYSQAKEHARDMSDLAKEGVCESDLMREGAERKAWHVDGDASGLATGIDGLESSTASAPAQVTRKVLEVRYEVAGTQPESGAQSPYSRGVWLPWRCSSSSYRPAYRGSDRRHGRNRQSPRQCLWFTRLLRKPLPIRSRSWRASGRAERNLIAAGATWGWN